MIHERQVWTVADQINAGLLIAVLIGIAFAWRQATSAAKTQRAIFLRDLYSTLNTDPGISEAFYSIEYERFTYDENFHASDQERNIDRLLSFLDTVCELYHTGVISTREMRFFEYRIRRISRYPGIQDYLDFLREFYRDNLVATEPFPSFSKYARSLSDTPLPTSRFSVLRARIRTLLRLRS